ncbi:hypothetical protein ACEUKD_09020 [Vibrio diabolicus]|uniref:hypothetical protein n=1 Tax=Vibrio diabolicus TaxID=50719 RepID=UPI0035A9067F
MAEHRFYHVDRNRTLKEGQVIRLDNNNLSQFGAVYWEAISTKPFEMMSDAEQRERILENIKREDTFKAYCSRMQAFFGANSIEDAKRFNEKCDPKPSELVPIYEVFASKYWNLDMNWLDYSTDHATRLRYLREYWYASLTNHNPSSGERRPPLIEVLMELPVRVGKVVAWV